MRRLIFNENKTEEKKEGPPEVHSAPMFNIAPFLDTGKTPLPTFGIESPLQNPNDFKTQFLQSLIKQEQKSDAPVIESPKEPPTAEQETVNDMFNSPQQLDQNSQNLLTELIRNRFRY